MRDLGRLRGTFNMEASAKLPLRVLQPRSGGDESKVCVS